METCRYVVSGPLECPETPLQRLCAVLTSQLGPFSLQSPKRCESTDSNFYEAGQMGLEETSLRKEVLLYSHKR